jgi:hypothetical protein
VADIDEWLVRRNPVVSVIRALIGVALVLLGISVVDTSDVDLTLVAAALIVLGLPQAIIGVHQLVTRSPAFRANVDGIWFGGGRIVPWRDVSAIYEVVVKVSVNYIPVGKGSLVKVDFRRVVTTFRLPLHRWPLALIREGVELHEMRPAVFVARLEAMRAKVAGSALIIAP